MNKLLRIKREKNGLYLVPRGAGYITYDLETNEVLMMADETNMRTETSYEVFFEGMLLTRGQTEPGTMSGFQGHVHNPKLGYALVYKVC